MSIELVRAYFKGTKYEERITIQPTHYNSTTSRVVMTQTYDTEV